MNVRVRRPASQFRAAAIVEVLQMFLLLAGVGALGYYSYVLADTKLYQNYENWAFEQELQGRQTGPWTYARHFIVTEAPPVPAPVPTADTATQPASTSSAKKRSARLPGDNPKGRLAPKAQDSSLIGRITIPRVHVAAIVREGVDLRTLRRAVGHVPGTALPGQLGNVGLAGHRDSFFLGLREIHKNDRIKVETLTGDYEYVVDSIKIVKPSNVDVLAASAEPVLTLVTCYPFNYVGSAPKRYIVRARLVSNGAKRPDVS